MTPRRVVVTGMGVLSALGADRHAFREAIQAGRTGFRPFDEGQFEGLGFRNAARVVGFEPREHFDRKVLNLLDPFAQYTVVAAREAVRDAGIELDAATRDRAAVVTGSSVGGQMANERGLYDLFAAGRQRVHPLTVPRVMASAGASHVAMDLGLRGPAFTVSSACSSSNHALAQALWMLRSGVADVALAGGSEALMCWGHLKAWEALRVVAPDTCRPFSRDRQGLILGDGAGMLVLETLEGAERRGATPYAELAGAGLSSDAEHITQPARHGPVRALRAALADAALEPAEIDYVNAHGTGTKANDATETAALREVFGDHADGLLVSSTKSMHGHALGASAALEAVATLYALRDGIVPPTANFTEPDPECDLDVVPNEPRRATLGAALSSSFAFGGLNAVLAFRAL